VDTEELILGHMPRVDGVANRIAQRNECLDLFADLCQEGYIALIDSAELFNESLGFKFWSWAYLKVKGAMFNALKQWHWNGIYRYPTTKGDDLTYQTISFDHPLVGRAIPIADSLIASYSLNMIQSLDIKGGLDILNERERHSIGKTFIEGYTLREVGQEWGLEESTVCNIRRIGLRKMREHERKQRGPEA